MKYYAEMYMNIDFVLFCIYSSFVCMCVSLPCVCLMSEKYKRKPWIPWASNYEWLQAVMWVLVIQPGPPKEELVLPISGPPLYILTIAILLHLQLRFMGIPQSSRSFFERGKSLEGCFRKYSSFSWFYSFSVRSHSGTWQDSSPGKYYECLPSFQNLHFSLAPCSSRNPV